MTEPAEAVTVHRDSAHQQWHRAQGQAHDERAGRRGGTRRWDRNYRGAAPGPGNDPADDPPSPDSVTAALRRLRDAAAAHDGELPARPARTTPRATAAPGACRG